MKHTKEYIRNLIKRIGNSDWDLMEKQGQYVNIAFSDYTDASKIKGYPVVNRDDYILIDDEDRSLALIIFEDQNSNPWILWDTTDYDTVEQQGYTWMLPLHMFVKTDEYVYYAAESNSNRIKNKTVYKYKDRIVKIGGELELQIYYDQNITAEFNFDIYKVPISNTLAEHPKLNELQAAAIMG